MNAKTDRKTQKKVTGHLHGRIKKLADAAIARGDIISCCRQPDDSYIVDRPGYLKTAFTPVGAGTLLYLLDYDSKASE